MIIEVNTFNSNSVDPDQTPRSAASDLGKHRLAMSLLCPFSMEGISLDNNNVL